MKRLHIGDIVRFNKEGRFKGVGVIAEISKYNTDSDDECEYAIACEYPFLEQSADSIAANDEVCSRYNITNECAWFKRNQLKLIRECDIETYIEED